MSLICVLPPHIANQIAAGEVVERPSSVVKELIENALDAGAKNVRIEIENGGIDLIRVSDNGKGMASEDASHAFLRHATSKISSADDLSRITTLGFRGEALASIAAVSDVLLRTRPEESESGTQVRISCGDKPFVSDCMCAKGTMVEVKNLFSNVPARLKFLKSTRTETGYISDYVSRMMMAVPDVAFVLSNQGKQIYQSFGDGDLKNAILCVYGASVLPHLRPINFDDGYIRINGFVGTEVISRPNRLQQSIFLNGRYIHSYSLSAAIQRAYDTRLMVGRFPFAVLHIRIAGSEVDVNVHPTKMEVRFVDESRIIRSVTAACSRALTAYMPTEDAEQQIPKLTHTSDTCAPTISHAIDLAAVKPIELRRAPIATAFSIRETPHMSNRISYEVNKSIRDLKAADLPVRSEQGNLLQDTPYTIIGTAFQTYWIVQQGTDLLLIDQHAAHERRLFEQLFHAETDNVAQPLLTPMPVSLSPIEINTLESFREELENIGFTFDYQDNGTILLSSVPMIKGMPLKEMFLHDALEQLRTIGSTSAKELTKEAIIQTACKHAVKAGESLTVQEVDHLMQVFQKDGIPMTCPHGRPVMIRLSKRELEKLFKRVL